MSNQGRRIVRWVLLIGGIVLDLLGRIAGGELGSQATLGGDMMVGAGLLEVGYTGGRRFLKKR